MSSLGIGGVTNSRVHAGRLLRRVQQRIRDKTDLEYVATLPCIVCGRIPTDAHHLRFAQPRAMGKKMGKKVSDEWVVPSCNLHHRALHDAGREEDWWAKQNVDPLIIADDLWENHRPRMTAQSISNGLA